MEAIDIDTYFNNVEDLSDPTLYDGLQMFLEQIQMQDDEFMEILLEKKNDMVVTWEQPWYQQNNSLTRPLKQDNETKLEKFRTDAISLEETKIIAGNWKNFRKIFGVPNTPICLARWKNKDKSRHPNTSEESVRRFVMAYLARGLERTIYQVYKYFISHYGNPKRGVYSKAEENVMAVCLYHNPTHVVPYVSTILGREPRGIYKKLTQLYNGRPDRKKLRWTLSLATMFLRLLLKYTEEPLENLKNKRIEKSVWLQLESDMEQNYTYLQIFWYHTLHVQLFVEMDVKLNRLRRYILKTIQLYPYQIWSDIRWKEIVQHFPDGFSHGFLYNITIKLINGYTGYRQAPLDELIEYGLLKIKTLQNKRLRTLILNENQELEAISYKRQE